MGTVAGVKGTAGFGTKGSAVAVGAAGMVAVE